MSETIPTDSNPASGDSPHDGEQKSLSRRDFIYIATGAFATVGAVEFAWPLIAQMGAAADTRAAASIEIDVSKVAEGQQLKVLWRGKPVFVRNRTAKEIEEAESVALDDLKDPQTDDARLVANPEGKLNRNLLVMIGVCTHFGCVPVGESGDFGGWYCPCHGSHYDTSGRIRLGPAPKNMEIPPYQYISDSVIKVG